MSLIQKILIYVKNWMDYLFIMRKNIQIYIKKFGGQLIYHMSGKNINTNNKKKLKFNKNKCAGQLEFNREKETLFNKKT